MRAAMLVGAVGLGLVVAGASSRCEGALSIDGFGAVAGVDTPAQAAQNGKALFQALVRANSSSARAVMVPAGAVYSFVPGAPEISGLVGVALCIEGTLNVSTANFTEQYPGWPQPWHVLNFPQCQGMAIVSETGRGVVNGRGSEWWWYKLFHGGARPQLLEAPSSVGMEVRGVTFLNAPNMHVFLMDAVDLTIEGVTVLVDLDDQAEALAYASGAQAVGGGRRGLLSAIRPGARPAGPRRVPDRVMRLPWAQPAWVINPPFPMVYALNTDGIDVSGRNISVVNCSVTNFDDAVCVKPMLGGSSRFGTACSSDIRIRDIAVTYGVGVSMGSVPPDVGGNCIDGVHVSDVVFQEPLKAVYVKPNPAKAAPSARGTIANVTYERLRIADPLWWAVFIGTQQMDEDGHSTGCSFLFPLPNTSCPADPQVTVRGITLRDVVVTNPLLSPGIILGNASNPIADVRFDGVTVHNASSWPVAGGYLCHNANVTSTGATSPAPACSALLP